MRPPHPQLGQSEMYPQAGIRGGRMEPIECEGTAVFLAAAGAVRKGKLVYRGKVGTGFDGDTLGDLAARLAPLVRKTAPVEADRTEARGATWVTPKLVAEIAFAEFTAEGRVRHASFLACAATSRRRRSPPKCPSPPPRPRSTSKYPAGTG